MTHRFYLVDVFAERPYAGNQLAVFVGDEPLDAGTMQSLAAETNFSETTFLRARADGDGGYPVRIFTPAREIAFTGHPILGTAWVLRNHLIPTSVTQVNLNLAVGQVPVFFETDDEGNERVWFRAPPMTLGKIADRQAVARALGLSPEDIAGDAPVQVVAAGTSAMIVPLTSLDALRRGRLNLEAFADLAADGFPPLAYLFCQQTHDDRNDLCARFFFEAHGVREDPATGNGAAFLGAYLLEHRMLPGDAVSIRIEQGYEVRRPSLVLLRAQMRAGTAEVFVGGGVIPTMQGTLL